MLGFKNCRLCSTVGFAIKKNPHVSGPTQFKAMLFKGLLYSDKFFFFGVLECQQMRKLMSENSRLRVPAPVQERLRSGVVSVVAAKAQV